MNDNKKIRAPKLAMTPEMMKAGLEALGVAMDAPEARDDDLVAAVFLAMWTAYWEDVQKVQREKAKGSPIVQPFKPKLIIPN
jgi:hypothetical protein